MGSLSMTPHFQVPSFRQRKNSLLEYVDLYCRTLVSQMTIRIIREMYRLMPPEEQRQYKFVLAAKALVGCSLAAVIVAYAIALQPRSIDRSNTEAQAIGLEPLRRVSHEEK